MTSMHVLPRRVMPELLDELDPADPRARRSRHDLRRVHRAMRSVHILKGVLGTLRLASVPRTIIEIGAGDGTLLLRLARTLGKSWTGVHLVLLDRHPLLSDATRAAYGELGWTVDALRADALDWVGRPGQRRYDLCLANLFLHHFEDAELASLLRGSAACADVFIGCEPRRDRLSLLASRLIGLLGTNAVTRADAVKSVAAGFRGRELSELWASAPGLWALQEYRVLPFTHCFTATRTRISRPDGPRG